MNPLGRLILDFLHNAEAPRPPERADFTPSIPLIDAEIEPAEDMLGPDILLSRVLGIDYIDAAGEPSRRRITLHRIVELPSDTRLHSYCHERQAPRLFLLSRVQRLILLDSGEVLEARAALTGYVRALARAELISAEDQTADVFRRCAREVNVLVFLARCDGVFHSSERDVLLDYLDYRCEPPGLDVDSATAILATVVPDRAAFELSIAQLAEHRPDVLLRVARAARRMIDADGVLHPREAEFAQALDRVLRS